MLVVVVAFAAAIILGVLDYRLDALTRSETSAANAVAIASKIMVGAGVIGAVLLLFVEGVSESLAPNRLEWIAAGLLVPGWICTVYCVANAGLVARALIHFSIIVAIVIAVSEGAVITWPTIVSMAGLIATTAATVWFYLKDNPRHS
jgi:hypothetical protein